MKLAEVEKIMKNRTPGLIGKRRECSVLIPLVEREDGLHLLFERRSSKMKTQPGDVCFPGGSMEPGETAVDCALRETREEIGIPRERIRILGEFDALHEVSGLTMYTVVGVIGEEDLGRLKLNPAEVDEVFTVPCRFFQETEPMIYEYDVVQNVEDFPYEAAGIRSDYRWRVGHKTTHIFHYGDGEKRQIIWGLTARITLWLMEKIEEEKKTLEP